MMKPDKARKIIQQLLFSAQHNLDNSQQLLAKLKQQNILTNAEKVAAQQQAEALQNESNQLFSKAKELLWKHFQTEDLSTVADDATMLNNQDEFKGKHFSAPKEVYSRKVQEWFKLLCGAASEAFACRIVLVAKGTECTVFAEETAELVAELLQFACLQMYYCHEILKLTKPDLVKVSYYHGFAHGVYEATAREQEKKETADSRLALPENSQALTVIGKKLARIDDRLTKIIEGVAQQAKAQTANNPQFDKSYGQGYLDGLKYKQKRIS